VGLVTATLAGHGQIGALLAEVLADLRVRRPGADVQVLDCAGGSGSLAVPLAADGASVTVVDTSVNALATLARRAAEAGVADRVRAVQGELENLDAYVGAAGYDLVMLHDVLTLVDDPCGLVAAASRAARPDGVVSIRLANAAATVYARAAAADPAGAEAALESVRAGATVAAQVSGWAADAGLTVERVSGLGAISGWVGLADGGWVHPPRDALAALDRAAAELTPFRDVAPAWHVLARRDG
jgi:2-polyprenyl-3-methyl-5-hydroxy-6-metoxy-1,4-benzoquinol methylase